MTERLNTGYAALQSGSSDVPVQVSGVAIGDGDVTHGGSGKRTLWPAETLREAAKGLQGQPIATSKNHTADGAQPQTPSDAVVGEVTWAGFKPGVGVLYEGEIDDPDIARSVENGRLEVSPLVNRNIEPLEESDEADYVATEIQRWRDLATVVDGAAPSNEITVGGNAMKAEALHAAVEALQEGIDLTPPESVQDHAQDVLDWREDDDKDVQGMTDTGWNRAEQLAAGDELSVDDVQEIAAWFARHGSDEYELNDDDTEPWEDNGRVAIKGWGGPPMREWIMGKRERLTEMGELEAMQATTEALKDVAGVTFDGTADGELDESEIPNDDYESHYLYPGDTKTESSYPVVDAEGNLRRGNVDAAWQLGARGGVDADEHDRRLMALAEEFETPPEWAMDDAESMADIADVSDGTLVRWDSSGDRDAYGMVEDIREEGDDPLDSEIDGDQTINPPAALIEVHTPGEDGWEATGTMVGHTLNTDTLTVIDELPDPESLAEHGEGMSGVPDEYVFDNPGEAMSKAEEMGFSEIHTRGEGEDTEFMPGASRQALLDELDMGGDDGSESMSQSNPAATAATTDTTIIMDNITDDELEALEKRREFDDPKLVEQDDYEALQSRVAEVRGVMEEALTERTDLKESTVEALGFEALCEEFEDDEGSLQVEAMRQTPESGEPDNTDAEALSGDADMEKAEALYADYQTFGSDALQDDICEALGVSDFDTAEEVLN